MNIIKHNPSYLGYLSCPNNPEFFSGSEKNSGVLLKFAPTQYSEELLQELFRREIAKTTLSLYPKEIEYQNLEFDIPLSFLEVCLKEHSNFFHVFFLPLWEEKDFNKYVISTIFLDYLYLKNDNFLEGFLSSAFKSWLNETEDESLKRGEFSVHGGGELCCDVLSTITDCVCVYTLNTDYDRL